MDNLLKLISRGLTKTGVTAGDGTTDWYDDPTDAAIAYAHKEAKQLQPDTQQPTNVQIPTLEDNGQPVALGDSSGYSDQSNNAPPPAFIHPNFRQASTDANGMPAVTPALTKKGALMSILLGSAKGAAVGSSQRNFGAGFQAAEENPIDMALRGQAVQRGGLENQVLANQIKYDPLLRMIGIQKSQADLNKVNAETNAIPVRTALEQAQANAANYKEDPNLGLVDIRTGKPVSDGAVAPLSADEAAVLGKNPGDRVPLKLKNTANEMVNRGIRTVQAGGRSLLVDGKGNTIKDMGAANSIVGINLQQGPYLNPTDANGNINPKLKPIIDSVGNYQMPLQEALSRVPPAGKAGFLTALKQAYPDFDQKTYEAAQKTLNSATSGPLGDQLSAYNTAILHANLLKQAAKAIAQHDTRALNALENSFEAEFGESAPLTFDALAHLYTGETTKVVAGGHITDSELGKTGATLGRNNSPSQIMDVLNAYSKAMKSKRDVTQNRIQQAMKGNVAYEGPNEGSGISVTDPRGGIHAFPDQASADRFKKLAGIQ